MDPLALRRAELAQAPRARALIQRRLADVNIAAPFFRPPLSQELLRGRTRRHTLGRFAASTRHELIPAVAGHPLLQVCLKAGRAASIVSVRTAPATIGRIKSSDGDHLAGESVHVLLAVGVYGRSSSSHGHDLAIERRES